MDHVHVASYTCNRGIYSSCYGLYSIMNYDPLATVLKRGWWGQIATRWLNKIDFQLFCMLV